MRTNLLGDYRRRIADLEQEVTVARLCGDWAAVERLEASIRRCRAPSSPSRLLRKVNHTQTEAEARQTMLAGQVAVVNVYDSYLPYQPYAGISGWVR